MRKLITVFMLCLILKNSFGQAQRKFSVYLQGQYNCTVYDATRGNNPWSIGLGIQALFGQDSKFKLNIDLTADAYLADDKVFRLTTDGTPINVVGSMVNLFAGASYHPIKPVYISFVAGPSFPGGDTKFGVKPSLGFYFSSNQKWTGKISYINIFSRDNKTKQDFRSISFSIGVILY